MNRHLACIPTAAVAVAVLVPGTVEGARVVVDPAGSGDAVTIAGGLALATYGDTVEVACGTYLERDLGLGDGIVLRSATQDPDCVTIDAGGLGRVMACEGADSTTVLEGFTLTGGRPVPEGSGGGLYCYQSAPRVRHCRFVGNTSEGPYGKGGALRADLATPLLESCHFEDNTSTFGGAVYTAYFDVDFVDCTFVANEADSSGGGVYLFVGSGRLERCRFERNRAPTGAGLSLWLRASPTVVDGIFVGNLATDEGGGLRAVQRSDPAIEGCTFVDNEAPVGAAMATRVTSAPTLHRTLAAWNGTGEAVFVDETSTVTLSCTDLFGNGADWVGSIAGQLGVSGNLAVNPLLCRPLDDVGSVAESSPCLAGQHPDGIDCGRIGTGDAACVAVSVPPADAATTGLLRVAPHPARTRVTIHWTGTAPAPLALTVVDAAGREVAQVPVSGRRAIWDLRDEGARRVAPGVYFAVGNGEAERISVVR